MELQIALQCNIQLSPQISDIFGRLVLYQVLREARIWGLETGNGACLVDIVIVDLLGLLRILQVLDVLVDGHLLRFVGLLGVEFEVGVLAAAGRLSFGVFFLILPGYKLISKAEFTYIWRDLLKTVYRRIGLMRAKVLTQCPTFRRHPLYVVNVV